MADVSHGYDDVDAGSTEETLYWQSVPGITQSTADAEADISAGRTYTEAEVRAQFNIPKKNTGTCCIVTLMQQRPWVTAGADGSWGGRVSDPIATEAA